MVSLTSEEALVDIREKLASELELASPVQPNKIPSLRSSDEGLTGLR